MNAARFDRIVEDRLAAAQVILTTAAEEYAHDSDRLANFKLISEITDNRISPEDVCLVYMLKHIIGISNYIAKREEQRDSVGGRITDAINYLLIMEAILTEQADAKRLTPSTQVLVGNSVA